MILFKYLFTLLFIVVSLQSDTTQITDKELILQLQKDLSQLKAEFSQFKKYRKEYSDSIIENTDYIEDVEANMLRDKINFGLTFRTNVESFKKTYANSNSLKNDNIFSTKFSLRMKADITDNMNFYGRLSMYKYWGNTYLHPYSRYDNLQGRTPSTSVLFVERAYINWFFNQASSIPMALTIGRLPTSDGPSQQYKNDSHRKGTYSALLYDGSSDGIIFTANISNIVSVKKTYLRLGYAKAFQNTETSNYVINPYIGPSNNDIKDTHVAGIFLDTTIPYIENSFIQLNITKMFNIVGNSRDFNTTTNSNIGDMYISGALIEFTNIHERNLDLFAHCGYNKAIPNTNSYLNYGGLLSNTGDTSIKEGHALWIGGRYGFGEKQKYKIGLEYNHGSKYWTNLTQGSYDIYNKLAARGDAYEAYAMYVINRYANIRMGYVDINYDYTCSGWFVGEPKKITANLESPELSLKELKSIYLKMNVNF